jgi:general secretion pathway protein D
MQSLLNAQLLRLSVIVAILVLLPMRVPAEKRQNSRDTEGGATISMDLRDADLSVLVRLISELTGKNFVLGKGLHRKRVTIFCQTKVTKTEAYKVFESILEMQGLSAVPAGQVIKVVRSKKAPQKAVKTSYGRGVFAVSDTCVTHLIRLNHAQARDLVRILRPLTPRESKIQEHVPTNTLILTDTGSNIARLVKIIRELDVKYEKKRTVQVIPLQYASAEVIARHLREVLKTIATYESRSVTSRRSVRRRRGRKRRRATSRKQKVDIGNVVADERTNSLIVIASKKELKEIRKLITKIDYDAESRDGKINVYYLEYADAERMAKLLSNLISGAQAMDANHPTRRSVKPLPARGFASFEGEVNITADTGTNSLLVLGTPRDFQTLRNVIEKLDIRRKQVYIEAVIMEVSPSFLQDLGMEYRTAISLESGDGVDRVLLGGTNFGLGANEMVETAGSLSEGTVPGETSLFPLDLGDRSGLTLGGIFDRIKIQTENGEISIPANIVVSQALHRKTSANILSTPHLIAMDNEEAEIIVGRNVPFITSTSQTSVSTVNQVQREEVGIILRFTPHITEGDYVQLELYQEISALIDSTVGQNPNLVGPTTSERKATNVVLVRDGQTIIVGGLMEDRIRKVQNKVPWLGDIPVLGWLFRLNQDVVEKQNLLIFLTPTLIHKDLDVDRVLEEKKRDMILYKRRNEMSEGTFESHPVEGNSP